MDRVCSVLFVGQVQVLSDHIEKLMMFLKHEATQKAKAHEQQRRLQKELELVKVTSPARLPQFYLHRLVASPDR